MSAPNYFGPYEVRFHHEMKRCVLYHGHPVRVIMTPDFWRGYFAELHAKGQKTVPIDPYAPRVAEYYWLAVPLMIEDLAPINLQIAVELGTDSGDHCRMEA